MLHEINLDMPIADELITFLLRDNESCDSTWHPIRDNQMSPAG